MKMTIIGIEISEGVSKKSAQAYSIGTLHTMTELAPPFGQESNVAKGYSGDKYECSPELLRKVQHLPFPLVCDVEKKDVIRFGERMQVVVDLHPVDVVKKAA